MQTKHKLLLTSLAPLVACSIHQQSPVKEVPTDFSDYYAYNQQLGTSPQHPTPDAGTPTETQTTTTTTIVTTTKVETKNKP